MTNPTDYEEWQQLCDKHAKARDSHIAALSKVNNMFAAITKDNAYSLSHSDEITEFENTWQEWEEVKNEMSAFIKERTGN